MLPPSDKVLQNTIHVLSLQRLLFPLCGVYVTHSPYSLPRDLFAAVVVVVKTEEKFSYLEWKIGGICLEKHKRMRKGPSVCESFFFIYSRFSDGAHLAAESGRIVGAF